MLKQELKKASNIFFIAQHETPSGRNQVLARLLKSAASGNPLTGASNCRTNQRFLSRAAGIFVVGRRPTHLWPRAEAARKKPENRARKVSGTQGTILANVMAFVKTSLVLHTFLSTFSLQVDPPFSMWTSSNRPTFRSVPFTIWFVKPF